jgi:uncharacterized phiE125 gp8 family phage protein
MPHYSFTNVTPPAEEPLTTAEAKKHLHIATGITVHDDEVANLVKAARGIFEKETRYQCVASVDDYTFDDFPDDEGAIYIPRWPLDTFASIKYQDTDDAEQTYDSANYVVNAGEIPPRITLAKGVSAWPAVRDGTSGSVVMRMTTGWADEATVPEDVKSTLKIILGHLFENREGVVAGVSVTELPWGIDRLLDTFRAGDHFHCYG